VSRPPGGSRRLAGGLAAGAAALGAGYWLCMSPYSQLLGRYPYRGQTQSKLVALTFDDGPNEPYTSQLADLLDSRGIKATFFQVGRAVLRHPEVTRRLVSAGHVVGNHGFTHEFTNYLRPGTLAADVRKGQQALISAGLRPALYRPPWLLRIPALRGILREHGLQAVLGEFCHPLEVFQPRAQLIADGALGKARPGSVIIFHDGFDGHPGNRASTVEAAKRVADRLGEDGYEFTTVDRLLGVPAYQAPVA
jgi:peptidoglycan-N-acetylglucosamine deacetylase